MSRSICGNENLHILLRLKTAIEIITNRKFYDTGRRSYVDLIDDDRILVSDYKGLVRETLRLGSYSEMINICIECCHTVTDPILLSATNSPRIGF